jgi:hemerythrin HHE cation binding domain-containing protein
MRNARASEREVVMNELKTSNGTIRGATLRAEHERLLDHADHIRVAALELPILSPEETRELIDRIVAFLLGPFEAYAESETRVLYPHLERLVGDPHATAAMRYDLDAIQRFADELARTSVQDTATLQELLYGTQAIMSVHFRKEDELYLPLLESERPEHLEHVLRAMREVRFESDYPAHRDL